MISWEENVRKARETCWMNPNLADYEAGKGMTVKTKVRIMVTVTILMSVGFIMMGLKGVVTGCVVLGCVWLFHIVYFIFGIKTIPAKEETVSA